MAQSVTAIYGKFGRYLAVCIFFTLLLPWLAHAIPPKYFAIENARVETRDNQITARLSISFDNVTGLFEMLKDGASVDLAVNAKLERVRSLWTNVTLVETDLLSSLQHNPLTREFSLFMPGSENPLLDKNLDRLLAATWSKFEVLFGPLSVLDDEEKDTEYRVTLTLALVYAKVPPWLAKNFMFWSRNIVEPETVKLPFQY